MDERTNQTLKIAMGKSLDGFQEQWEDNLKVNLFAHNGSVQAVLQAQLQMQSLGKGNLSVGKDGTAFVPPVSTDSCINPPAQSPQSDSFHAQPVSLIQPTETITQFSP